MDRLRRESLALLFVAILRLLVAQKEIGDVDLGCPASSYKFGNFCYALVTLSANYDDAELACETAGGRLAIIRDMDTYLVIQKLRIRKFLMSYWMGLNDRQKEGQWMHGDNTRLQGYENWFPGEPNNAFGQHCGIMWMLRNLLWDDDNCNKRYLYTCQTARTNCSADAHPFGPYCYELSTELATYDEAEFRCKDKGGELVSIKTKEINEKIKSLIYAERRWKDLNEREITHILRESGSRLPSSWIGLRYIKGEWVYSDGEVMNSSSFTKWGPGEPNNARNIEHCVMTGHEWYDVSCDNIRSFLCQYPVTKNEPITPCPDISDSASFVSSSTAKTVTLKNSPSFRWTTRKSNADPLVQSQASKGLHEEDSGIRIGSVQFTFLLLGCFVLGAIVTLLVTRAVTTVKKMKTKARGERLREEQDVRMLEHEITNHIFFEKGFGSPPLPDE